MTAATEVRPPLSNRGANWHPNSLTWDWYQATLGVPPDTSLLLSGLERAARGSGWTPCSPLYGYAVGYRLQNVPAGSVQVFLRADDVHVQATSVAAVPVVEFLRQMWPDHRVSRADVALDVDEPGAFDRLWRRVHELARQGSRAGGRKVSTSTAGDWIDGEQGRTFYAGGTSSRLRVVVYEKGHEQIARDPGCGASLDWCRVEWRVRPDTPERKAWLARATPSEALGLTPFGAEVGTALLDSEISVPDAARRFASQDPAYWMARQYRRTLLALLELDPLDMRDRLVQLVEQSGTASAER